MDKDAMMKSALLLSIVAVSLYCAGCRSNKFVGVWDLNTSMSKGPGHSSFTFNKDGTFKSSFETKTNTQYTRTEGSGTYTSDKDTLTLDYKALKLVNLHLDGSAKGAVPMHPAKSVEKVKVLADGKIELSSDAHNAPWTLIRR